MFEPTDVFPVIAGLSFVIAACQWKFERHKRKLISVHNTIGHPEIMNTLGDMKTVKNVQLLARMDHKHLQTVWSPVATITQVLLVIMAILTTETYFPMFVAGIVALTASAVVTHAITANWKPDWLIATEKLIDNIIDEIVENKLREQEKAIMDLYRKSLTEDLDE